MSAKPEAEQVPINCSKCGVAFVRYRKLGRVCRSCLNKRVRAYRKRTRNKATRKYEKTKRGFLMRAYRNMVSRVTGVQKKSLHLYLGLGIIGKEAFYEWSWNNPDFHELFEAWEKSNYAQRLTPSVDRIHPGFGYKLLNIQWVTVSENSKRAAAWRYHNKII